MDLRFKNKIHVKKGLILYPQNTGTASGRCDGNLCEGRTSDPGILPLQSMQHQSERRRGLFHVINKGRMLVFGRVTSYLYSKRR